MNLSGKKILVTGADGFIGSHLVHRLVELGHEVRAFVLYNSFNSCGWLDSFPAEVLRRLEIVSGDIRDPQGVRAAVQGCPAVLHLAALIAIPYSYRCPDSYVDTNIKGTLNVLNAARDLKAERVVLTSTSETYGSAQYIPIDEKHPLQAQSPYAASKIAADQLGLSYHRSFSLPVSIIRPFNTFGPRQSARAIIPTIISQLLAASSQRAHQVRLGSLFPVRDLTYVTDTVAGFIAVAQADAALGRVVNVGTGYGLSIQDLFAKIAGMMGVQAKVETEEQRIRPPLSEVDHLCADITLAKQLVSWEPVISLDEGLKRTIEWFSNADNLRFYRPDRYNL